jgi:hypothetical protein
MNDKEFAQWVETHSLEKLIGTAGRVPTSPSPQKTKRGEASGLLRVALNMPREDLEAVQRIARKQAISSATLLRTWIHQRLKREQRRATG